MNKRKFCICLILLIMVPLLLTACIRSPKDLFGEVRLTFNHNGKSISIFLSPEEVSSVLPILEKNFYNLGLTGTAPEFDENVSLKVSDTTFSIACDGSAFIRNEENGRYFAIMEEEIKIIHKLFESYGGYFPCN